MSSVFDMLGPVMVGPSSSHTAGVVRIGKIARKLFHNSPQQAKIRFYNSFSTTYQGHGSDRAVIAGILDFNTDDKRIKNSLEIAEKQGLKYEFIPVINNKFHPNTLQIELKAPEKTFNLIGVSRGGGLIKIIEINGLRTFFTAQFHTLIIRAKDISGSIAFITDVIAHDNVNIGTMTVDRKQKNDLALLTLEMDNSLKEITLKYLAELDWVFEVSYLPPLDE